MKRNEFIKMCGILGIGLPLQSSLSSCGSDDAADTIDPTADKVIIIGAGAGGLSAGYLLQQRGIDFEILEASSVYGGRMRINNDFTDFPIPLGSEWLETDTSIFQTIVNDSSVAVNKLYFAGGPYTDGEDWVSVHTAALSAKTAVEELLG